MKEKRILVCPLDWGLGHATRCIPIIRELSAKGCKVIIGADNHPLALLREEFPDLEWIKMPGYKIEYPSGSFMAGAIIKSLPAFIKSNIREHKLLDSIIDKLNIDAVISDNRYGLWTYEIPCVIITHQLMVRSISGLHWLEPMVNRFIKKAVKKFTFCWVPDVGGPINFSGKLAHHYPFPSNSRLTGPLSRFKDNTTDFAYKNFGEFYTFMAILSGPEPQRSIFEKILITQFSKRKEKCLIVRGLPGSKEETTTTDNITFVNHLPSDALEYHIRKCETLICRSGYSTIMDLAALNKNAILVATPGQTEQEYLASRLKASGNFYSMPQSGFRLSRALEATTSFKGPDFPDGHDMLERAINEFTAYISKNSR